MFFVPLNSNHAGMTMTMTMMTLTLMASDCGVLTRRVAEWLVGRKVSRWEEKFPGGVDMTTQELKWQ